jgi:hypothetical protein
MSLTPSTSDATSLDRATLLAAGGVLLLITALFAILGALPHDWTLHKSNIPRPMLCIAVIFVFMLATGFSTSYRQPVSLARSLPKASVSA